MNGGADATQLLDPGSWCAVTAWLGLVLVGLAILMTLLDWGELSGLSPQHPPRRRWARVLAVAGVALMVVAGLSALVLG
jgi:hypothetical protein